MNPDIAISEAESVVMDILWRTHPVSADPATAITCQSSGGMSELDQTPAELDSGPG